MRDTDIHDELEALRREIAALRAERAAVGAEPAGAAPAGGDGIGTGAKDALKTAAAEVERFTVAHPLPALVASLVVGLTLGRLLSR